MLAGQVLDGTDTTDLFPTTGKLEVLDVSPMRMDRFARGVKLDFELR